MNWIINSDKKIAIMLDEEARKFSPSDGDIYIVSEEHGWIIFNPFSNQPERSKREDLNCDNCKIPRIFNCCFNGVGKHSNDESCEEFKFKMRCSEHCGNTVRDK